MRTERLLIFDLDNTIFDTNSISHHHVAPVIGSFKASISSLFPVSMVERIISDVWIYPFDHVAEKYELKDSIRAQFSKAINTIDYKLDISPYPDFKLIEQVESARILVTTGFEKLQQAKIKALELEHLFDQVYIDEIDSQHRIYKKGIFQNILKCYNLSSNSIFIIGDNPYSELKAGHELGLTTIQVAKNQQQQSAYATHYIKGYDELVKIVE